MNLPELLARFHFDGRFEDRVTQQSLSYKDLLEKYKDYSPQEQWEFRCEPRNQGNLYLALGVVNGPTGFLESSQSREKRLKNCCLKCGLQGAVFTYRPQGNDAYSVQIERNWKWEPPSDEWNIAVSHDNIGGWICAKCQDADPGLGKYLANNRILNAMSNP